MSLIVVSSERFVEHATPPGHPESPERAEVMDVVAAEWRRSGGEVVAPREATHEQLARVHTERHLQRIANTAGQAVALDPDTFTSPDTYEIAKLAAGAAVDAVERVLGGTHTAALALVRPPGHHAERDRAMGFCFYNNIAVAAAHARAQGAHRVAIVDYDVHHGNGTQHTFERDPDVLYVSTHQFPYYPGTGDATEVGLDEGRGSTVNVPMEVGSTDQDYQVVFSEIVLPVLRQFQPDLLLVSAGFDAHERDPLAGMRVTTEAFGAMTTELMLVARECCGGRLMAITEGGYDLAALGDSLRTVVRAMAGGSATTAAWPVASLSSARGAQAVRRAKTALAPYWKL
jgi:acetoin utilization deacetylase AcuC-like enzyme